ncbi:MAG: serine/threonine protein kinase [Myxococcota bacterium]
MNVRNLGNYNIIKRIGLGGLSEIFLAEINAGRGMLNQKVVIKKLLPHLTDKPKLKNLIKREALLLSSLNHANIVKVLDAGVDGEGHYYMVQEYIDGYELREIIDLVRETGEILPGSILYYLTDQILRALVHLHELSNSAGQSYNLVHRDISPTNIMVSTSGNVKLLDFGLAKKAVDITVGGNLTGKLPYMSPEQLMGRPIDPRSDIFSLGTVLYELASGKYRFNAKNDLLIMQKIKKQQFTSLVELDTNLPPEFIQIIEGAMAYELDCRYRSCREMFHDFSKLPIRYPEFMDGRDELADFLDYNFGATKIQLAPDMEENIELTLETTIPQKSIEMNRNEMAKYRQDLNNVETVILNSITQPDSKIDNFDLDTLETRILGKNMKNEFEEDYKGKKISEIHPLLDDKPVKKVENSELFNQKLLKFIIAITVLATAVIIPYYIYNQKEVVEQPKELQLLGKPEGARVFINDREVGKLPIKINLKEIRGKKLKLEIKNENYFPWQKTYLLSEHIPKSKKINLRKYVLELRLLSDYPGMRVKIDSDTDKKKAKSRRNKKGEWLYLPLIIKDLEPGSLFEATVLWKKKKYPLKINLPKQSYHQLKITPQLLK